MLRTLIQYGVPVVVIVGVMLLCVAVFLILNELKPTRLRHPDGSTIPAAADEFSMVALLTLDNSPDDSAISTQVQEAMANGKVVQLPDGTRVRVVARQYFRDGRLRPELSLRTSDKKERDSGIPVDRVRLVGAELAGKELWVHGQYCSARGRLS